MKTAKILADFKQEVAEKYGFKRYNDLIFFSANDVDSNIPDEEVLHDEIAELHAAYKEWNAKHSNWTEGFTDGHKEGWNEALHWAAENLTLKIKFNAKSEKWEIEIDKQSILKGLKP